MGGWAAARGARAPGRSHGLATLTPGRVMRQRSITAPSQRIFLSLATLGAPTRACAHAPRRTGLLHHVPVPGAVCGARAADRQVQGDPARHGRGRELHHLRVQGGWVSTVAWRVVCVLRFDSMLVCIWRVRCSSPGRPARAARSKQPGHAPAALQLLQCRCAQRQPPPACFPPPPNGMHPATERVFNSTAPCHPATGTCCLIQQLKQKAMPLARAAHGRRARAGGAARDVPQQVRLRVRVRGGRGHAHVQQVAGQRQPHQVPAGAWGRAGVRVCGCACAPCCPRQAFACCSLAALHAGALWARTARARAHVAPRAAARPAGGAASQ